ncbi:MAG: DUF4158 domain-containing protein, partial [Acidobacteriaceae bacterium]|nr:DUF4158 domain-containing protein [Acidobacteriaceae bacterium]
MPVGFLTEQQRRAYGRFNGEPTPDQLARYFYIDDSDRKLIGAHRGDYNRLGFAVQLCTARFLGTFLEDVSETPPGVVAALARQLQVEPFRSCFDYYCNGEGRWDHAAEIRKYCGFVEFSDPFAGFRLNRWLYALCWTGTDRPGTLFDRATTWLITHKVLLPGVSVLERHIASLRNRAQERLWAMLTRSVPVETHERLATLLALPEGGHQSLLDRLRKGPYRRSAPELVRALRRIDEVRGLGIDVAACRRVPPGRVQALARFAMSAKASAIQRLPEERRLATLVAFATTLEAAAQDDALDLLDILITEIFSDATKAGEKARLRTIKDLDAAAMQLGQACQLVLDPDVSDADLRSAIFNVVQREELQSALGQVVSLVRPPEDMYYQELQQAWGRVRKFLLPLLTTVHFGATPAGKAVLQALEAVRNQDGRAKVLPATAPLEIIGRGWRKYVIEKDGTIDKKAYVFCCLDRLRTAIRRRDVFIAPSIRYADPRIGLLSGTAWESSRSTVCRSLGHTLSADETIAALNRQLDQTYRAVAVNLPNNTA